MITLNDVLMHMESSNNDSESFYHKVSEKIISIDYSYIRMWKNDGLDEYESRCLEWEKEVIKE